VPPSSALDDRRNNPVRLVRRHVQPLGGRAALEQRHDPPPRRQKVHVGQTQPHRRNPLTVGFAEDRRAEREQRPLHARAVHPPVRRVTEKGGEDGARRRRRGGGVARADAVGGGRVGGRLPPPRRCQLVPRGAPPPRKPPLGRYVRAQHPVVGRGQRRVAAGVEARPPARRRLEHPHPGEAARDGGHAAALERHGRGAGAGAAEEAVGVRHPVGDDARPRRLRDRHVGAADVGILGEEGGGNGQGKRLGGGGGVAPGNDVDDVLDRVGRDDARVVAVGKGRVGAAAEQHPDARFRPRGVAVGGGRAGGFGDAHARLAVHIVGEGDARGGGGVGGDAGGRHLGKEVGAGASWGNSKEWEKWTAKAEVVAIRGGKRESGSVIRQQKRVGEQAWQL